MDKLQILKEKLRKSGISMYKISQETGITESALSKILGGKVTKPHNSTINTLYDYFNKVSINSGSSPVLEDHRAPYITRSNIETVPLVEEYAQVGFIEGYDNSEFIGNLPRQPIKIDRFNNEQYFAFRVVGDSMDNGSKESIMNGSIVVGRSIPKNLWHSKFHMNKFMYYIFVHRDGILVGRIKGHNEGEGVIICESLNQDKDRYPDVDLNINECKLILNIVNIIIDR